MVKRTAQKPPVSFSERDETRPTGTGRKSAESKERILDAALAEFAERGLGGARVDKIAERADINKRMLYEYVGNKESLWLAALERVYEMMRIGERDLQLQTLDPLAGMEKLVRFNFQFHANHPEFISMVNEENRQRGRSLKHSVRMKEMYLPLVAMLTDLLQRGVAEALFRDNVDPMQLYISIAALSYFYCSNQHTLSAVFGRDLGSRDGMQQREDHVVECIMGYLRRSSNA